MINIVSRAPNDNFSLELFETLLKSVQHKFEAYYLWSGSPEDLMDFLTTTKFTQPNVVIGIKDLLDLWQEYNFWSDKTTCGLVLIDKIARENPDKNFIIFNSLEHVEAELITAPNVQFISWGGDIVNQADLYQTLEPVLDKNFDSIKAFISLNRNARFHRLVLLSYLFGTGYDQHGYITYLKQQIDSAPCDNLLDCISWEFGPEHDDIRVKMLEGYPKFYNNSTLATDDYEIYKVIANDNVTNFNQCLRPKYQNSFVEIITESTFSSPSFMITEKTLNSFYGCNFPILLSGCGAVEHMRSIGFDMFDDIIDHAYDTIANPFDRIVTAVESNRLLLIDADHAKNQWAHARDRFIKNISCARQIYSWYHDRTVRQFQNIHWH